LFIADLENQESLGCAVTTGICSSWYMFLRCGIFHPIAGSDEMLLTDIEVAVKNNYHVSGQQWRCFTTLVTCIVIDKKWVMMLKESWTTTAHCSSCYP